MNNRTVGEGFVGLLGVLTIEQINTYLATVIALLTIAHLVRRFFAKPPSE
jgi:hypothetical protein